MIRFKFARQLSKINYVENWKIFLDKLLFCNTFITTKKGLLNDAVLCLNKCFGMLSDEWMSVKKRFVFACKSPSVT